jgi:hypothetical protein
MIFRRLTTIERSCVVRITIPMRYSIVKTVLHLQPHRTILYAPHTSGCILENGSSSFRHVGAVEHY